MTTDTQARQFAVVTGASSGIGLELARQFAGHGFDVMVCAEDGGLASSADSLRQQTGATITPVQADLATPEGVEELYAAIQRQHRPLDAVALNAGLGAGGAFVGGTDLEQELEVISVNVTSTVHLAKRVLPDMVRRGEGRVLFTSSIASGLPGSFNAVYNASKSFVQSFAEAIRNELKDTGVTVTALMPGPTDTDFFERAGMQDTKVGKESKDDPAKVAEQGFEALMRGDDHVVAGSMSNKVQAAAAKLMPEQMKAERHRAMAGPGSADEQQ